MIKRIPKIFLNIIIMGIFLSGCSNNSGNNVIKNDSALNQVNNTRIAHKTDQKREPVSQIVNDQQNINTLTSTAQSDLPLQNKNDREETVVINVDNYGRANPFRPFQERSLFINEPPLISGIPGTPYPGIPTSKIPPPPAFNENPEISTLLSIKVAGIMYGEGKSSAIIKVKDNDYLVHKGDMLFNFYVQNITPEKVTIKLKNNTYQAGIGEIIDGVVNVDPVKGAKTAFSGSNNSGSPDIKLTKPTYVPTIR